MDQQQVEALYQKWEAAKDAVDVAAMVALFSQIDPTTSVYGYMANCSGYMLVRHAKSIADSIRGFELLKVACRVAEEGTPLWYKSHLNTGWAANRLNAYRIADKYIDKAFAALEAAQDPDPFFMWVACAEKFQSSYWAGKFSDALIWARASNIWVTKGTDNWVKTQIYMANALSRSGEGAQAVELLTVAIAAVPDSILMGHMRAAMGLAYLAVCDFQQAIVWASDAERGMEPVLQQGIEWKALSELHEVLATAHRNIGHAALATRHQKRSLAWNDDEPLAFNFGG